MRVPSKIEITCPKCHGGGGWRVGESNWQECRYCRERGVVLVLNPGPAEAFPDVPVEAYER